LNKTTSGRTMARPPTVATLAGAAGDERARKTGKVACDGGSFSETEGQARQPGTTVALRRDLTAGGDG